MTGEDQEKYSVLIRCEYSRALGQLSNNRFDRDRLIKEAIEDFLEKYTPEQREEEIHREESQVRIESVSRTQLSHRKFSESIHLPNDLVERVILSYPSLDTVLNTALRVYLQLKIVVDRHRHHISTFKENTKSQLDYGWDGVNFHIRWTEKP